jgi:hypothetical protein
MKSGIRRYLIAGIGIFAATATVTGLGWTSPDGWNNPGGTWRNGQLAYDENEDPPYFAEQTAMNGWGDYIELTLSTPIYCDKVRIKADFWPPDGTDQVSIGIYNGSWTNVFTGAITNADWTEIPFTGMSNVTMMRFAWNWANPQYIWWLYEADFWAGQAHTLPSVQTNAATSVTSTTANLHGQIINDGYTSCQHRFEYGTTTSYGSSTSWGGSNATGQTFGNTITGLVNGTTYHFRAQAQNDIGTVSGSDMTFSTGAVTSGWISPSSHGDPGGSWNNSVYAYDDEDASIAWSYHAMNTAQWSNPLILIPPSSIACNSIRFLSAGGGYVDGIKVEVYDGGNWTEVYNGVIDNLVRTTVNFTQQTVTQAQVSLHVSQTGCGLNWNFYEFDFYKVCAAAPTLDWTGETNYGSGGVYPLSGYPETDFTFRVKYTDACNAGPSVIQVWVDKNGDGDYTDAGEKIDLTVPADASPANQKDGDYTNGEIFSTTLNLDYGPNSSNISYKFVANNGTSDATGSPTGAVNNPDVTLPPQRNPQWSKSGIGAVKGSAITESVIYVGTDNSSAELICVDLSNGNTIWTYDAPAALRSPTYDYAGSNYRIVAAAGTTVIFVQDNGGGRTELWNPPLDLGSTAGNPFISYDDASVYVAYTNYITKVKLSDKSVYAGWPVNVPNVNINADMAVFDDAIYAATSDGKVCKVDRDGTPLGTFNSMGGASVDLPLLATTGSALYIVPNSSNLYAINTSTMLTKWGSPVTLAAANTGPAYVPGMGSNVLYVAAGYNVQKVTDNGSSGSVIWTYNSNGTIQSGPLPYGDKVYFGRNGGRYYTIQDNVTSGTLITYWPFTQAAGDATTGPWIDLTNNRVIFGTTGGNLQSFSLE